MPKDVDVPKHKQIAKPSKDETPSLSVPLPYFEDALNEVTIGDIGKHFLSRILPGIFSHPSAISRIYLLFNAWNGTEKQDHKIFLLPEMISLFGYPSSTSFSKLWWLKSFLGKDCNEPNTQVSIFSAASKILFSFPVWRFLTQRIYKKDSSLLIPSLVESFGLTREIRSTDKYPKKAETPERDRFGTGFRLNPEQLKLHNLKYSELRRAYLCFSDDQSAVILRNS